uniref:Uncharacterized protein n=1 Tax=Eutreptiella gymnastica TaxID=73025 RepID=A0A7S1NTY3_9EUGL
MATTAIQVITGQGKAMMLGGLTTQPRRCLPGHQKPIWVVPAARPRPQIQAQHPRTWRDTFDEKTPPSGEAWGGQSVENPKGLKKMALKIHGRGTPYW